MPAPHCDFLVYGSNIESLLIARFLRHRGLNVVLASPLSKISIPAYDEFKYISKNSFVEKYEQAFKFFDIPVQSLESQTLTAEKGQFVPFVGFGDLKLKCSSFFSESLSSNKVFIPLSEQEFLKLYNDLEIRAPMSLTDLAIHEELVQNATFNDSIVLTSENFIFTNHPSDFFDFLKPVKKQQKNLHKVSNADSYALLSYQFTVTENNPHTFSQYVLFGTTENSIITSGSNSNGSTSWISYIQDQGQDLSEEATHVLKEMKRHIKKTIHSKPTSEKISLVKFAQGYVDLKSLNFGQIEGLNNFIVSNHCLIEGENTLFNSILSAYRTCELLNRFLKKSETKQLDATSGSQPTIDL